MSSHKFMHVDFNLVKKRKFYEKQDEDDQGSDRGKMCFVFCGALLPATFLGSPIILNLFDNPAAS